MSNVRQVDFKREPVKEPNASGVVLEWAIAIIGIVLVSASVGYLAYQGFTGGNAPPEIRLRVEQIAPAGNGYIAKLRAINAGDVTAAQVQIVGELKNGDEVIERSEMQFDFLPSRSERIGGLIFSRDPRKYTLELRAEGYQNP
jgi:uncharacterized protein (TIGR02588 family)